jgi:hypothetical protein
MTKLQKIGHSVRRYLALTVLLVGAVASLALLTRTQPTPQVHIWTQNEAARWNFVSAGGTDEFRAYNGPEPSVGLYWFANFDPTTSSGMNAPLFQLLIRTDNDSIYYKSGNGAS